MTTLHLTLTAELKSRLEARAAEGGYASVEQYAQAVLAADADGQGVDEQTEDLLLRRLDDPAPGVEFTPDFKDQFREQVRRRRLSGGAGS